MKESEPFELDWLLTCKLEELIASVRPMSAKNCEKIARVILDRIGGPSFEQLLMRIVETMVPRDGRGPPTNSDELYFSIRDLFPHVPPENDVLGKLLCFAMRMCQLRIEKIPISPRIEQDLFMLFAADALQETLPQIISSKAPNMAQVFDAA